MLAALVATVLALEIHRSGLAIGTKKTLVSHWPVLAGYATGGVLFAIESTISFGGVTARIRGISKQSATTESIELYLGSLLSGTPFTAATAFRVGMLVIYVALIAGLAIGGLVVGSRQERWAVLPAFAAGAAIGTVYLLRPGDHNSIGRFLIPALVLISLAGTPLWRHLLTSFGTKRATLLKRLTASAVAVAVICLTFMSLRVVVERGENVGMRERPRQLAKIINDLADSDDCAFGARYALPQIQIHTSCVGRAVVFDRSPSAPTTDLLEAEVSVLVGPNPPTDEWFAAGWNKVGQVGTWMIWKRESPAVPTEEVPN